MAYSIRFVLCALLAFPTFAHAKWAPTNGPGGHTVNAFAVHGAVLFSGTSRGLFQSTDAGSHWTMIDSGLTFSVNCFSINGNMIFAGTDTGIIRSTNEGANWEKLSGSIANCAITSLAQFGDTLFAATPQLFRSLNNGNTWDSVNMTASLLCTDINHHLYAARSGGQWNSPGDTGGVFVSVDYGLTWTKLSGGLPVDKQFYIWDPSTGQHDGYYDYTFIKALTSNVHGIFAGTLHGVYRSTNAGTAWQQVDSDDSSGTSFGQGDSLFTGTVDGFVHC